MNLTAHLGWGQHHPCLADADGWHRHRLQAAAYRMLGSPGGGRGRRSGGVVATGPGDIGNLAGRLTTVVGRVCLDMLRARKGRREESLDARLPDPLVSREGADPEQEALLADSVGLALQVVLESLTPAERLAFVLHDLFEQIAPVVDRTSGAAKKLASRARRRVRGAVPSPDPDLAGQRRVVDAFQTAAPGGNFDALLAILDPDVVMRANGGSVPAA